MILSHVEEANVGSGTFFAAHVGYSCIIHRYLRNTYATPALISLSYYVFLKCHLFWRLLSTFARNDYGIRVQEIESIRKRVISVLGTNLWKRSKLQMDTEEKTISLWYCWQYIDETIISRKDRLNDIKITFWHFHLNHSSENIFTECICLGILFYK